MRTYDSYNTYTPPELIDVCEKCPYPEPKCGQDGCAHFREKRAEYLAKRNDKCRKRKERLKRLKKKKERCPV